MAIADVFKGSEAVLECSLETGPFVDVSAELYGMSGLELNTATVLRDIPGGGKVIGSQDLGYEEGTSTLTIDANRRTFPLFNWKSGRRHRWRYYPEGKTTGKPIWTWESLTDVVKRAARPPEAVVRFTCTLNHDGKVDRTGTVQ